MACLAEIRRVRGGRSAKDTTSSLCRQDLPSRRYRSSRNEWSGSDMSSPSGSPNTVDASLNVTPCLRALDCAFLESHSNIYPTSYTPEWLVRWLRPTSRSAALSACYSLRARYPRPSVSQTPAQTPYPRAGAAVRWRTPDRSPRASNASRYRDRAPRAS